MNLLVSHGASYSSYFQKEYLTIIYTVLTFIECKYIHFKEMKIFRLIRNLSDFNPQSILFDDFVWVSRETT